MDVGGVCVADVQSLGRHRDVGRVCGAEGGRALDWWRSVFEYAEGHRRCLCMFNLWADMGTWAVFVALRTIFRASISGVRSSGKRMHRAGTRLSIFE